MKVQRYTSVEPLGFAACQSKYGMHELYDVACHLNVDVMELLVSSK